MKRNVYFKFLDDGELFLICGAEGRLGRGDLIARMAELKKIAEARLAAGKSVMGKIVSRPVEKKSTQIAAA